MNSDGTTIKQLLRGVNHKPLAKDEELVLLKKAKKGDKDARDRLVEANQRFVIRVAQTFRNQGVPVIDLIQEGTLGLIEAIDRYDCRKNCRLISYAAWWIRLYMQRAIEQKSRTVNIPINKIASLKKIKDFEYGFIKSRGRKPFMSEISNAIGMNEEKVRQIYNIGTTSVSIHAEDDDGQSMEDRLELNSVDPLLHQILQEELKNHLNQAFLNLTSRERDVLCCRFGLEEVDEPLSLRQAGKYLGLSAEGVRQIQAQAFKKLTDPQYAASLHAVLHAL